MTETRLTRMLQRRDTLADWTADNPILGDGEIAIIENNPEADQMKIGDGERHFNDLPFFGGDPNASELVYDLWVHGNHVSRQDRLVRVISTASEALAVGAWDSNDLGPGRWQLHAEYQTVRIEAETDVTVRLYIGDSTVPATIEFAYLIVTRILNADGTYPNPQVLFGANSVAPTPLDLDTNIVVIGTEAWGSSDVDPADYTWDGTTLQVHKQGLYSVYITLIGTTP